MEIYRRHCWIHKHDTNWGIAFGGYPDEQGTKSIYELETAFDQDLNDDGDIGEPSINSGQSIFSIKGTAEVGNTLSISVKMQQIPMELEH